MGNHPVRFVESVGLAALCIVLLMLASCDACDRSTGPGTREPDYVLSPMPGGGTLVTARELIPEHLQANCDVCPEWCTQVDLRPLPLGMLLETYRQAALDYAARDTIRNAEGWQLLEQMACIAAGSGPVVKTRFMALTTDSDPAVRFPAAVHALRYGFDSVKARASLNAMIGDEIESGVHDGPDGEYYATWAHNMLIDHEMGGGLDLP